MGSAPEGPALDALLRVARRELHRLREEKAPSLFPSESRAACVQQVRLDAVDRGPLSIADVRKLEEEKRLTMGFHEVFGPLYDPLRLGDIFHPRPKMAARLFKQIS